MSLKWESLKWNIARVELAQMALVQVALAQVGIAQVDPHREFTHGYCRGISSSLRAVLRGCEFTHTLLPAMRSK